MEIIDYNPLINNKKNFILKIFGEKSNLSRLLISKKARKN